MKVPNPSTLIAAMTDYTIRLAEAADAADYVQVHTKALVETYSPVMPPGYAAGRLAEIEQYTALRTESFKRMHDDLAAGRTPERLHWVATDPNGQIVGLAAAGVGQPPWDHLVDLPAPPVAHQLDHIYTLAIAHGSGLGQQLLDLVLPNGRGAHLWILEGNSRAETFYRRNRFERDGVTARCGPAWFGHPMFRMWRPDLT